MELTDRQQAILDFLTAWQDQHGYPPTRAEIARAFGFSQARSAEDHLRALAAKGAIVLETRNLERLGSDVHARIRPDAVDQALLDEFGRLVLGLPNRFRELARRQGA